MTTAAHLTFDPGTGELRGPAGTTRLAPQPSRALEQLLAAGGELVSRQELIAVIWPGERFGVSERLTYCIHQLREALVTVGLDGVVETLPRRGYRIAAMDTRSADPGSGSVSRFPAVWPALVALLVLVLLAGVAPRWLDGGGGGGDASHQVHAARHAARH